MTFVDDSGKEIEEDNHKPSTMQTIEDEYSEVPSF